MNMLLDYEKIGFRIGQRRRELKLKQRQLAEMIGVSYKYISNLETGSRHINLEMIALLCDALEVTPDYFLLGNIRKETNKNISDKIQLCSKEDQEIISQIIEIYATKNNN
jgi:transcriptional regulator with XRE-family HTH domain